MGFKFVVLVLVLMEVGLLSIPLASASPNASGILSDKPTHQSNSEHLEGIFGGHNITIDKAKYIGVLLDSYNDLLGTATILNSRWVLATAYNMQKRKPADVQIRVGSSYAHKGGQLFQVEKIFMPKQYSGFWNYDVALAKLSAPLKFSGTVGPMTIATRLPAQGSVALTAGYGWTETSYGGYLTQVALPISHFATCKPKMPDEFTSLSFCTIKEGAGPCAADFGSPLVYKNKLVGIFLGTYGCGGADTPSAFADLSQYRHWIQNIIKHNTQ